MYMKNDFTNFVPILSENIAFNELTSTEFILSNTNNKHYLKINIEVYHLFNLLHGKRTINEIVTEYKLKYGHKLSISDVQNLLFQNLQQYGILKGFDDQIKEYEKPSYLNLSFIILNEKLLSRIVKYFYFLFNKHNALFFIITCVVFISCMFIQNFNLYKDFNLRQSLVCFFIVMASSATIHEIGHATSAGYFGAKHGGIGGGFYLFTPVYFADVTDIWKLDKMKRIVVNLSGMYFELIFCSLLAFIGYVINNDTLLMISIIVCIKTLFNLNPFLRSDGYWVVSDLTSKPNLLHHSLDKVKDIYRFILLRKKFNWNITDFFLLGYGLICSSFIFTFLYYVLIKNPNSILNFPENAMTFFRSVFMDNTAFSIVKYGELIIPLMFFILAFKFLKSIFSKIFKNNSTIKPVQSIV
jgi:putative peptide zinc metalloprotease protein